jgi:hypothetical protein
VHIQRFALLKENDRKTVKVIRKPNNHFRNMIVLQT